MDGEPDSMAAQGGGESPESPGVRLLKVLAGPQRGAEATLLEGDHLLGSAEECDFVLCDASVAPEHARLVVHNGEVRVQAADSGLTVDGRPLQAGQAAQLAAETVIGIGTTVVAIGTAETDWSHLVLLASTTRAAEDGRTTGAATPESANAGERAATDDNAGESRPPADGAPEAAEPSDPIPAAQADSEEQHPARHGRVRRLAWIAAVLVVIVAISLVTIHLVASRADGVDDAAARAQAARRSMLEARKVVAASGFPELDVSLSRDGTVVVEGYTPTAADKQTITGAFAAKGIEADQRIWPVDGMMSDVRETLDRLGGGTLGHRYVGHGTVAFEGYYSGTLSSDELAAIVGEEVPAVRSIQSGEHTLAEATADMRSRIRRASLADFLSVTPDGARVAVTGVLDPDQMKVWQEVRGAFDAAMNGLPHVESSVRAQKVSGDQLQAREASSSGQASPASRNGFPRLSICGVMGASKGPFYALLDDGVRLGKGDVVNRFYVVEEIGQETVVLRRGTQRKVYYLGGNDE